MARRNPGFAATVVFGALASSALADDLDLGGDTRASSYAGVFIPQVETWRGSGVLGGLPFNATGKLSSNVGWTMGAGIGHTFDNVPGWEWLNIDLSVGYVASTFSHFEGTIAIDGVGSFPGSDRLAGQYHTAAGFVNFLATPWGIRGLMDDKITPFFGVGPGIASSTAKIQSISVGGLTFPINGTSSETDFAFDAIVGADYAISERWELGLAYQYTWINAKHLGGGAALQPILGHKVGHSIGV